MTVREKWNRRKRIMAWMVLVLLLIVAGGCSKWSGGGPSLPSTVKEPASAYDKRLKKKIGVVPFRMESIFGDPTEKDFFQDNLLLAIQEECVPLILRDQLGSAVPNIRANVAKVLGELVLSPAKEGPTTPGRTFVSSVGVANS